jgi:adenylate cyclase
MSRIADLPLPETSSLTLGRAADFLLHHARGFTDVHAFLDRLAQALADDGVVLERLNVVMATLHPQVAAITGTWRAGQGVEIIPRPWANLISGPFLKSPIARFHEGTHDVIRRHLADGACPRDFEIVDDLRSQGFTDYLAYDLGSSLTNRVNVVSYSTKQPGGFTAAQLDLLLSLRALMALVVESHVEQRVAVTVLQTYLGEDAGSRVLAGQVQRGQGETIRAVVSFSDLRNFTGLSDRLPRQALLELLDDTFDCVVGAVTDQGGEVLKFIGDAVLTVFRVHPGDEERACIAARAAAAGLFERLAEKNTRRGSDERPRLDLGLSLHLGEVHYGNIGGASRLDFTVIGPAVNLASRVQGLCPKLGRRVLVTGEVARHLAGHVDDLGAHELKGIAAPVQVYGLDVGG